MWHQKVGNEKRKEYSYQSDKDKEDDSVFLCDSLEGSVGLTSSNANSDLSEAEVSKIVAPLENARDTCYLEIRDLDEESLGLYGFSSCQQHKEHDRGLPSVGEEEEEKYDSAKYVSSFKGLPLTTDEGNISTFDQARKPASETWIYPKYENSTFGKKGQKGIRRSSAAVLVPAKMEYSVFYTNAHYSDGGSKQQTVRIQQQSLPSESSSQQNRVLTKPVFASLVYLSFLVFLLIFSWVAVNSGLSEFLRDRLKPPDE